MISKKDMQGMETNKQSYLILQLLGMENILREMKASTLISQPLLQKPTKVATMKALTEETVNKAKMVLTNNQKEVKKEVKETKDPKALAKRCMLQL